MFWKNKDEQYYIDRAEECYNNHEYEDAIKNYTKAIEIDPENAEAYYKCANIYYELKKYNEAVADYTKVIEICNNNIDIKDENIDNFINSKLKRVDAYFELGNYKEAFNLSKEYLYIEYDKDNYYVQYSLSDCLDEIRTEDEIVDYFKKALKNFNDLINQGENLYFQRGVCYMCLENYDLGIQDIKKAFELDSNDKNIIEYKTKLKL